MEKHIENNYELRESDYREVVEIIKVKLNVVFTTGYIRRVDRDERCNADISNVLTEYRLAKKQLFNSLTQAKN